MGSYNPRKKNFQVKEDRVKYWISQNIETSETVHNLLVTKGFVTGSKVKAFSIPKKEAPKTEASPAPAAAAETPAEVKEATVEMEAKIEQAAPQTETAAAEQPAPEEKPAA